MLITILLYCSGGDKKIIHTYEVHICMQYIVVSFVRCIPRKVKREGGTPEHKSIKHKLAPNITY